MENEVLAVQNQFWTALTNKDRDLFEAILAPDFIALSPGEPDQSREELIEILTGLHGIAGEISGEGMRVHIYGDIAVLTGVQVAEITLPGGGSAIISRIMLTNVFRNEGGQWRIVLSHAFETLFKR